MKPAVVFLFLAVTGYAPVAWTIAFIAEASTGVSEKPNTGHQISSLNLRPEKAGRFYDGVVLSSLKQDKSVPQVKIVMPENSERLTWDTQVRYSISVSDVKDGESKYGEINASEVLLAVEYLPIKKEDYVNQQIKKPQTTAEHKGLTLMKRSTCFGCHADKSRLAGPAFSEIAGKYEKKASVIKNIASHIIAGSSGVWGSLEMPSHPDFTPEQAEQIVNYILEQGGNKYRWINPGLEGAFRTIAKPEKDSEGVYLLTASYTSQSQVTGQHSVIIQIK